MRETTCPECGCPISNETVCPECGCPIERTQPSRHNDRPSTNNYNEEEEPYTPFSPTSWFFLTPALLNKYPQRGDFAKAHPFFGWLFNPWHLSFRGNGNIAAYDALNNIFLFANLLWKTLLFPFLWTFLKMFWWIVAFVAILIVGGLLSRNSGTAIGVFGIITSILYVALAIFSAIVYLCGWGESLRRYISPIYDTFMRICKRFSISIAKSARENNLNV